MHVISLAGSERQKSKLRNGHKVRVKHGKGFNVIVSPNTYQLAYRAFNKNKGLQMQLSPEEIEMNRAPSPELHAQIMGHNKHLILPDVTGALVKGSGIGDWFRNLGNDIKTGFTEKIINPVKEKIIEPAKQGFDKYVKPNMGDIKAVGKLANPFYLAGDFASKLAKGQKIQDIGNDYKNEFGHLNDTKNRIIKSSPVLTTMYTKGVPALAGLATGSLAGLVTENPLVGAVAGAAGQRAGEELLKAEGYGLHHIIRHGLHHAPHLHHHHCPVEGGKLGFHHITDFFKHAGNRIKDYAHNAFHHAKHEVNKLDNWLLDHPEFAEMVKHHGSKLAGLAAREGIKYLTGSQDLGDLAGDITNDVSYANLENRGYGLHDGPSPIHPSELHGHEMVPMGSSKSSLNPDYRHKLREADAMYEANLRAQKEAEDRRGIERRDYFANKTKREREESSAKRAKEMAQLQKETSDFENKVKGNNKRVKEEHMREMYNREHASKPVSKGFWQSLIDWWTGKNKVQQLGHGLYAGQPGGHGLYSGGTVSRDHHGNYHIHDNFNVPMGGMGFHSYSTLKHAADADFHSNMSLGHMSDNTVLGQHHQPPIKTYWDEVGQPLSRGYGLHPHVHSHHRQLHHRMRGFGAHDHHNLIGGRGRLIEHTASLPPALTSQPYGANFHLQFQLPPEYHKYNDGTDVL